MSKKPKKSPRGAFLSKVTELRQRARKQIEEGAVTPDDMADLLVTFDPKKSGRGRSR